MLEELDKVVLTHDIKEYNLKDGERGTIVHVYSKGEAYEVEFFNAKGKTIAVLTLMPDEIRPYIEHKNVFPSFNAPISLGTVSGTSEGNVWRVPDTIFSIDEFIIESATPRSKAREEHYQTATL